MVRKQEVVGYTRVTNKEMSEKGYSLESQKQMLLDYADNNNLTIIEIFSDIGSKYDSTRNGLNEMFHFLEASENCKTILVTEPHRLYPSEDLTKASKYSLIYTNEHRIINLLKCDIDKDFLDFWITKNKEAIRKDMQK